MDMGLGVSWGRVWEAEMERKEENRGLELTKKEKAPKGRRGEKVWGASPEGENHLNYH